MLRRPEPSFVSLHAAATEAGVALCAAQALPAAEAGAPEWVHVLPAGTIATGDGRGPYRVSDAAALIAASMAEGDRLPIDENHATDLAGPRGEPAPARGWITELQARQDGIWGRVEWTPAGARLVKGRAYRGLSPVIRHLKTGEVTAILRASLVNKPNLRGLTALHQENDMDLLQKLLAAIGLDANTTEDQLVEKITALHAEQAKAATALQAALEPIAKAAGLKDGADAAAVLAGVEQLAKAGDGGDITANRTVTALQAELTSVATELKTLREATARDKATAFVDGAIKEGRVGLKPVRDDYIALHMEDPAKAERFIAGMPKIGGGNTIIPNDPPAKDGEISLNAEQKQAARLLGLDEKAMAATLKAEREAAL